MGIQKLNGMLSISVKWKAENFLNDTAFEDGSKIFLLEKLNSKEYYETPLSCECSDPNGFGICEQVYKKS